MLSFRDNLYIGDKIEKTPKQLIRQLKKGQYPPDLYLLTRAYNQQDQLDIFRASQLSQPAFKEREIYVIGLASGRRDALNLLKRLAADVYQRGLAPDIRSLTRE